ncbi:hypothetical protein [Streptomyces sp. NPDC053069]|uniref:hypothetical protein n=1 Tax=Streptomyces sp. NPDC053069 TaxID=3365695 RepID=UPI0037CD45FE
MAIDSLSRVSPFRKLRGSVKESCTRAWASGPVPDCTDQVPDPSNVAPMGRTAATARP